MSLKTILKKLLIKKIVPERVTITNSTYLTNKVSLIVGGSGGIGFAIAKKCIENGSKVIITGTDSSKLEKLCSQLDDKAEYVVMDITKIESIVEGVLKAQLIYGRIDILINSAGYHGNEAFGNVSEDNYDQVLDINLKGLFFTCQEVSNYMIKNNIKGHILNVSSSSCAKPAWTPYEISKWGVRGFTLGLADTLIKHKIVVNAIAPGPVATKMLGKEGTDDLAMSVNPSGRMSTPEEIANLAVFMVSGAGDMIVGDTYFISGGSGTIKMHNS